MYELAHGSKKLNKDALCNKEVLALLSGMDGSWGLMPPHKLEGDNSLLGQFLYPHEFHKRFLFMDDIVCIGERFVQVSLVFEDLALLCLLCMRSVS